MYEAARSWSRLNPDHEYRFYDDGDILLQLGAFDCAGLGFSAEELRRAYDRIVPGAGKADLFRYLIVYRDGGCYFDVDCTCKRALSAFVREDADLVSGVGERGDLHQWGLVYRPRHPFLRRALELSVRNVLDGRFEPGYEGSLEGLTGPPVLDAAVKGVLGLPARHRFVAGSYELGGHAFHVLDGDLGDSMRDGRPALTIVLERVPMTLAITLPALLTWWTFKDQPWYKAMPDWQKDNAIAAVLQLDGTARERIKANRNTVSR
jgi:hypothetical protein